MKHILNKFIYIIYILLYLLSYEINNKHIEKKIEW